MCMACEMEAMWFAAMEARARAVAANADEADAQTPTLLPPLERGRVGEGGAGDRPRASAGGMHEESADPLPNPPPEEGEGGAQGGTIRSERAGEPRSRFSCEETQAE